MTHDSARRTESDDGHGLHDRVQRLFRYLRELALLRTKTVRDVADYDKVIWLSDLPEGMPASTAFDSEDDAEFLTSWLDVDRVRLPEFPEPPVELVAWLDRSAIRNHDLAVRFARSVGLAM